jgi:hypothetical protein
MGAKRIAPTMHNKALSNCHNQTIVEPPGQKNFTT